MLIPILFSEIDIETDFDMNVHHDDDVHSCSKSCTGTCASWPCTPRDVTQCKVPSSVVHCLLSVASFLRQVWCVG